MKPLRVFIIQPFTARHSEEFKNVVVSVCNASGGLFQAYRADDEPAATSRLQDRIDSYIKKADICVADLCGTRNENALLEVGAAYTLSIPVVAVSDRELPSDIIGNLWITFDPAKASDEEHLATFRKHLEFRLREARREIGRPRSGQFMAYAYDSRRNVDFYSLVNSCEKRISILTTNLGFVVDEPLATSGFRSLGSLEAGNDTPGAGQAPKTLLEMIASKLSNKPPDFMIRILSLDPDSNFTNDRASALDRDKREFRDAMRQDLEALIAFVKSQQCTRSFQIKLYDESPLQMTYFFDDEVVASVVAKGRSSRDLVTYQHSLLAHGAKETYEQHFENLWGGAKLVASAPVHLLRPRRSWQPATTPPVPANGTGNGLDLATANTSS